MRRRMAPRLAQGQAGVYAVAAQLLLRGINPCFPAVDAGADIITDWGTRIQVKSSYRRPTMWGGTYRFCLTAGMTVYTAGHGYKKTPVRDMPPRIFSNECDFFVMWGIDDNRFWILPASMCDGRNVVGMVGKDTPWLTLDQEAIKADHKAGMSSMMIAERHHLSKPTVLKILRNVVRTDFDMEFNKSLLKHENRWDLLLAAEQLLSQGESELTPASAEEVV